MKGEGPWKRERDVGVRADSLADLVHPLPPEHGEDVLLEERPEALVEARQVAVLGRRECGGGV